VRHPRGVGALQALEQLAHQLGHRIPAAEAPAGIQLARFHRHPAAIGRLAHLEVQVGPATEARAANPADHLPLAHPIARPHVELREVAVEGAAQGAPVLKLHRQAVAAGGAAGHHPPGEGRQHGGALRGRQVATGMHQPAAQQGV